MRRSFWQYLSILSFCLLWVFLLLHCAREDQPPSLAPDFTLKSLDGREVTLSGLRGKAILLDFWATWCGPCRESIPHLIQLYKTFNEKGLEVIGMSMDKGDGETVRRFVNAMDIPYSITLTPDEVARQYGVTGLPTAVFIDRKGMIRQKIIGFSSEISRQMSATAAELLAENP